MDIVIRVAAELVNLLTPGEDRGRRYVPPEGDERTAAVGAVLRGAGGREAQRQGHRVGVDADDRGARQAGQQPDGWAAGCATGLAVVLGGDLYDRLGVCTAPRCDRVYVDTSRNGTRRYCSTSCQNRVKTAAFRARLS